MSPNLYSLIYALEFYARYELCIEPYYNNGKNVIAHRYIYTPLSHDKVRGTKTNYLKFLYKDVISPDVVFFMDVKPMTAYQRIVKYRKPTFFECGLDIEYNNNLGLGFKRFKEGFFSTEEIRQRFLDFQDKVYKNYLETLPEEITVIIDGDKSAIKQKMLQKIIKS